MGVPDGRPPAVSFSLLGKDRAMPEHLSKERVERDGYLVYAEGDPIPDDDTDELRRQGYLKSEPKAKTAGADKSRKATTNK